MTNTHRVENLIRKKFGDNENECENKVFFFVYVCCQQVCHKWKLKWGFWNELVNEKRGSKRRGSKKDEEEARRGRMEKFSLFGDALGVVGK